MTTVESGVFKDDGGRKYQAMNDDYTLPADDVEHHRLNAQHQAWKIMQGDKNHLAPIDQLLEAKAGKEELRILDIGAGTGIWAIEIAEEFPQAQVFGVDLAPVRPRHGIPSNCQFLNEDATKGLSFSDNHFDVVHFRALICGIQDWPLLLNEAIRITKPGGLVVSVDGAGLCQLDQSVTGDHRAIAPGYMRFSDLFVEASRIRGLDAHASLTIIPETLNKHGQTGSATQVVVPLPMTPWSDELRKRRTGEVMVTDAKEFPATMRVLISDACKFSAAEYEQITQDYLHDVFETKIHAVLDTAHVWTQKL